MRDYQWLHEYCLNRFGSAQALEARLPQPRSAADFGCGRRASRAAAEPKRFRQYSCSHW